ncbi:MAG: preprotein translocase subunit YajC [Bacteroidaceae bacterium]|nr:preprotein translocase subunit YajC [Bacteroidaceae bacterium]MBR1378139.1 preprotein translocase subunit YajC [Bacteroidaceae bacterium]
MPFNLLDAAGNTQTPQGGMDYTMIIMLVAMFAILYFFMIRPQQKKQKEIQKFRNSLTVGSKVITAGGVYGTVKDLNEGENYLTLEVSKGVTIQIDRNYVFADTAQATQK